MGDKALSVFLGNLLLQNTTIASAAMPQIEITVATPASMGATTGNPAADLSSTLANLSRVPLTGNVERDLARIATVMPNLRFTVSSPLGNTTFVLPKGATLGDIQTFLSSLTSLADPATLANVFQSENPAAAVLTLGSHSVFAHEQNHASQPALTHGHQPLLSDARGHGLAASQGPASEARFSPAVSSAPFGATFGSKGSESSAPAKAGVPLDTVKLPEVVRDVLISLRILPPGVSTEQALPRLQEVLRLWTAGGAQHADLPADVVKVVSNFLASAVLATTIASTTPGATPLRPGQSLELQRNLPNGLNASGSPAFGEGARPGFQFGPLTRSDIASAVLSALSGSPTLLPSTNGAKNGAPVGTNDASHNGAVLPGSTVSEGKIQGDKNGANGRFAEGVRGDLALDRGIRDLKTGQTRISGDEHLEKTALDDIELKEGRFAHDQESHAGAEDSVENVFDSVWPNVLDALRRENFLDNESDLLSLRPFRDSADGGRFVNLVASMVPQGYDPLDLLSYMAEGNRLRWATDRSEVNAALYEMARYQNRRGVKKFEALLDPLRDVELLVEMAELNVMVGHSARA